MNIIGFINLLTLFDIAREAYSLRHNRAYHTPRPDPC